VDAYYYTLSSLPFLTFGGPLPLSFADFVELCAPWLSRRDLARLRSARMDIENLPMEEATHPMIQRWVAFENTLRNELVRVRAKRLGLSPADYLRPEGGEAPSWIPRIHRAIEGASPLEAELNLLALRWEFLTDSEVGHPYDLAALMIYGLKLQILERMKRLDEKRGREILALFHEKLHEQENRHERG
jgi:hypothetical protein